MITKHNDSIVKKNLFFLGLMNKNKNIDTLNNTQEIANEIIYIPSTTYTQFLRLHVPIISALYNVELAHF